VASPFCLQHELLFKMSFWVLLVLFGFVLTNCLQTFYFVKIDQTGPFFKGLAFVIPGTYIVLGYAGLIKSPLKAIHSIASENDKTIMMKFDKFMPVMIVINMWCSLPLVKYGFEATLLPVVILTLYLSFKLRNVSSYTWNYFSKEWQPLPLNSAAVYKYWKISLLVILLKSLLDEYQYRGNWLLWGETFTAFLTLNFLLFKATNFLVQPGSVIKKTETYLPGWSNKFIIVICGLSIIFSIATGLYLD